MNKYSSTRLKICPPVRMHFLARWWFWWGSLNWIHIIEVQQRDCIYIDTPLVWWWWTLCTTCISFASTGSGPSTTSSPRTCHSIFISQCVYHAELDPYLKLMAKVFKRMLVVMCSALQLCLFPVVSLCIMCLWATSIDYSSWPLHAYFYTGNETLVLVWQRTFVSWTYHWSTLKLYNTWPTLIPLDPGTLSKINHWWTHPSDLTTYSHQKSTIWSTHHLDLTLTPY